MEVPYSGQQEDISFPRGFMALTPSPEVTQTFFSQKPKEGACPFLFPTSFIPLLKDLTVDVQVLGELTASSERI